MEAVAQLTGVVRRQPPRVRQWLLLIAVAVAGLAVLALHQATVPYDPLANATGIGDVVDVKPGATYTVVYPVTTDSRERATIESGSLTADRQAQPIALHGLSSGLGYGVAGSSSDAARRQHARLTPIAGLRFATAPSTSVNRSWLGTYAFVAVTVRALPSSTGCIDLPALNLQYRVGNTQFHRTVPSGVRFAMPGTNGDTCFPADQRS